MRLDDYLQKNESVDAGVEAYDSKTAISESQKGKLAVTPNRVVFVRENGVSDISLNGVSSIEYNAPSYPTEYLYWGVGLVCLSVLLFVAQPLLGTPASGLSVIAFISGICVIGVGFLFRRSSLTLHTANSSFEFVSNDARLIDIAHALRGHETR